MRHVLFLLILFFGNNYLLLAQDCYSEFKNYKDKLASDTSIYYITDSEIEIKQNRTFALDLIKSVKFIACPTTVLIAFVIEKDESISNVFVCAKMICLEADCDEDAAKLNFESIVRQYLASLKVQPGRYKGNKVRTYVFIPLHINCQ